MDGEWLKVGKHRKVPPLKLSFVAYLPIPPSTHKMLSRRCLISSDLHRSMCYISLKAVCVFTIKMLTETALANPSC